MVPSVMGLVAWKGWGKGRGSWRESRFSQSEKTTSLRPLVTMAPPWNQTTAGRGLFNALSGV